MRHQLESFRWDLPVPPRSIDRFPRYAMSVHSIQHSWEFSSRSGRTKKSETEELFDREHRQLAGGSVVDVARKGGGQDIPLERNK